MNPSNVIQVNPVIDHNVRKLCVQPYPGHPKGCPNYNKKEGCPPKALFFDDVYDLNFPVFAIYNVFDLQSHVLKMKERCPEWSDRQLKCCLYWQPTARKQLNDHIIEFTGNFPSRDFPNIYMVEKCPEAMGVNITQTMKNAGIELEWPPEKVAYQIALAGMVKNP